MGGLAQNVLKMYMEYDLVLSIVARRIISAKKKMRNANYKPSKIVGRRSNTPPRRIHPPLWSNRRMQLIPWHGDINNSRIYQPTAVANGYRFVVYSFLPLSTWHKINNIVYNSINTIL